MTRWDYPLPSSPYGGYRVATPVRRKITTSAREVTHISIAALVLTGDIALIEIRTTTITSLGTGLWASLAVALSFGATAALTGFLFHELAHKIAAQRRGYWSEFRMSPTGLLLSVVTSLFGFLFAAPGATIVQDMYDPRAWGRTALAGPAVNLVEGSVFLAAGLGLAESNLLPGVLPFLYLLAFFNGWFATFNLFPVGPLDGRKVLHWSLPTWAGMIGISGALALVGILLFYGFVTV
jgi:Zn-dependent protease